MGNPSSGGGPHLLWGGSKAQPPQKPGSGAEEHHSPGALEQHDGNGGAPVGKKGGVKPPHTHGQITGPPTPNLGDPPH